MDPIIVIQYKQLERLPPTMAHMQAMQALGRRVIYLGLPSAAGEDFLLKNHIEYWFMPDYTERINRGKSLFRKIWRRFVRLYAFLVQRRWVRQRLMKLANEYGDLTIWHSEVASAALVGDWGHRFVKRIMVIFELSDFKGAAWWGFSFQKCLNVVRVVVPEYNRAFILQESLRLPRRPAVLPNKPYAHPRERNLKLPEGRVTEVFRQIGKRPVFLYQGVWTEDREDVTKVVEIIARNRSNYCVVCMPECDRAAQLASKYENVFTLPKIPAPRHLSVTSHATVGIAVYTVWGPDLLTRLNEVYCAPNKIFEYAGFGVPTLGSALPGMSYTIGAKGAGVCCDMDEQSIVSAADELVLNWGSYSKRAGEFFDSVDIKKIVQEILEEVIG